LGTAALFLVVWAVREFPQRIVNKVKILSIFKFVIVGLNLSGKNIKTKTDTQLLTENVTPE
jgi:hypothetical protein